MEQPGNFSEKPQFPGIDFTVFFGTIFIAVPKCGCRCRAQSAKFPPYKITGKNVARRWKFREMNKLCQIETKTRYTFRTWPMMWKKGIFARKLRSRAIFIRRKIELSVARRFYERSNESPFPPKICNSARTVWQCISPNRPRIRTTSDELSSRKVNQSTTTTYTRRTRTSAVHQSHGPFVYIKNIHSVFWYYITRS